VFRIVLYVLLPQNKIWQRFSIRAQSSGRQNQSPSVQANAATCPLRRAREREEGEKTGETEVGGRLPTFYQYTHGPAAPRRIAFFPHSLLPPSLPSTTREASGPWRKKLKVRGLVSCPISPLACPESSVLGPLPNPCRAVPFRTFSLGVFFGWFCGGFAGVLMWFPGMWVGKSWGSF
jgi:hypothetical protein